MKGSFLSQLVYISVPWHIRIVALVTLVVALTSHIISAQTWLSQGPVLISNGQVDGITGRPVIGAAHTVLADPLDANVLWIGGTNGGVWKTTNALDPAGPDWVPLIDEQPSLSIGAMEFDYTDPSYHTVVVGTGRFSSLGQFGNRRIGLLRTTDAGATWDVLDGEGLLVGKNISGVMARGGTIVVSVNVADEFVDDSTGIFRSTDGGITFNSVSLRGGSETGLPTGVANDLASHPNDPNVLYTSIVFGEDQGGRNGVYRSADLGATWDKVEIPEMDELLISGTTSNVEFSVGGQGQVFAGVVNSGQLAGLFRSDDGHNWMQIDAPATNEGNTSVGINPRQKGPGPGNIPGPGQGVDFPGGQGNLHFSIRTDPYDPNVVYVGGDRQPLEFGRPNSVGASTFTGRLFRVDASLPSGSQSSTLTHLEGVSTTRNSAPHADSREMVFDAKGDIVEVDDGGIYKRTNPQGLGDWFSLNGDLQITELHSVDWDANSNIIIGGTQDVGTIEQKKTGSLEYRQTWLADGGRVLVDDSTRGTSLRFSSFQKLDSFIRRHVDENNVVRKTDFLLLTINGENGKSIYDLDQDIPFYPPVELNKIDQRLVIGTKTVYESLDQGDTLDRLVTLDDEIRAIAAGGFKNGESNAEVLYVGAEDRVFLRESFGGELEERESYPGEIVRDIVLDPVDWSTAFITDPTQVFVTNDAGESWLEVTGNLVTENIRTIEFIEATRDIVVGSLDGVFMTSAASPGDWWLVSDETLPNAPVFDLNYDAHDKILLAGTVGRGAWLLNIPEPTGLPLLAFGIVLSINAGQNHRRHTQRTK